MNRAAFAIHSQIHKNLPHVTAAAHTILSTERRGQRWVVIRSSHTRLLRFLRITSCSMTSPGLLMIPRKAKGLLKRLARKKRRSPNHGLLTAGKTIDEVAWWYITMERTCQAQLMAEATGDPVKIRPDVARLTRTQMGLQKRGILAFSQFIMSR